MAAIPTLGIPLRWLGTGVERRCMHAIESAVMQLDGDQ